jgi:hypothetical protein
MDEESATADSRVTTTSGCFGGTCTAQRNFSLNALPPTDKTCGFRRTRQRRSHAGTRLPRSLVRQASTDLRFSRQSRSILWAVNFRSSANDDGNSIRYMEDTCDFLPFHLHMSRQQHLEAPTSAFPSRVPNGGAPVEAPPPARF